VDQPHQEDAGLGYALLYSVRDLPCYRSKLEVCQPLVGVIVTHNFQVIFLGKCINLKNKVSAPIKFKNPSTPSYSKGPVMFHYQGCNLCRQGIKHLVLHKTKLDSQYANKFSSSKYVQDKSHGNVSVLENRQSSQVLKPPQKDALRDKSGA
jgi:hypothetical protein